MDGKICMINAEKLINTFPWKYAKWRDWNSERALKRYFDNKDKTSNQWKVYYEKKDKI